MSASERALALAQLAAEAADSKQALDIVALDVSEPLPLADVFVIASGRSERQVQAIAEAVEDQLREQGGAPTLRREGRAEGRWVLVDVGDVVVHVFHEDDRHFYQLERLWADCPVVPLELPEVPSGD